MNRRRFLGAAAAVLPTASAQGRPPNILFAIADDMSFAHMGCAGDRVVRTPAMDRVARDGVRFTQAFCCSPSCTPSRAAVLTGQHIWRLKESGNLWSTLRKREYPVYPDLLAAAGYHVGLMRKGWGPGDFTAGGFSHNPAGPNYKSFDEFVGSIPDGKPFCFWFGTPDPHRPYDKGSGVAAGMKVNDIRVPPFLPDVPEIRSDVADYYFEVQRFDRELGAAIALLEKTGALGNTLVVITSDNGMPFPRCKTNLYDYGARMPLLMMWPERVKGGREITDFVNLADLAPTFLEAAGLTPGEAMTGRSLLSLLTSGKSGRVDPKRDHVVIGRERHTIRANAGRAYPMRALRTDDWLYIRNYAPERWPAGAPPDFADIDGSPSKAYMVEHREDPEVKPLFDLACAKRPAEELYDVKADPYQIRSVASEPARAAILKQLRERLTARLVETADPRVSGGEILWDTAPYFGQRPATQRR